MHAPVQLTSHITSLISPLAGHTSSPVMNSRRFTEMMGSVHVESDEILVSFYVSSLFTNVPVGEAVSVIGERLREDKTLGDMTSLSREQIADLLEMCLKSTYFSFGGNFYEQVWRWAPQSLLWWPTSTWSSLRSWYWKLCVEWGSTNTSWHISVHQT